jgi:hypothetical protein
MNLYEYQICRGTVSEENNNGIFRVGGIERQNPTIQILIAEVAEVYCVRS